MGENKTKPAKHSVGAYIGAIDDEARRRDCKRLAVLMAKIAKSKAKMWGSGIVGFGSYRYKGASGREGEFMRTGFSSRKSTLAIYLMATGKDQDQLLTKLGKHSMGKSCLNVRQLENVDMKVLERLIAGSIAEMKRRYPN